VIVYNLTRFAASAFSLSAAASRAIEISPTRSMCGTRRVKGFNELPKMAQAALASLGHMFLLVIHHLVGLRNVGQFSGRISGSSAEARIGHF
jgi:hypothetical protein